MPRHTVGVHARSDRVEVALSLKEQQTFLSNAGRQCPLCRSVHIGARQFTVEGHTVYQEAYCGQCKAEWEFSYTLKAISTVSKLEEN